MLLNTGRVSDDGHIVGGPFYYIENGMGPKWKWLAKIFAVFGVGVGLLGIGTFTQINGISNAVKSFFDPSESHTVSIFGTQYSWAIIITAIVITLFVALVLIGGLKRISSVAQVIVPFMAIIYVLFALIVIVLNIKAVPGAFKLIVKGAFNPSAVTGGAIGSIIVVMQKGIAMRCFLLMRQGLAVRLLQQPLHRLTSRQSRDLYQCSEHFSIQLLYVQ